MKHILVIIIAIAAACFIVACPPSQKKTVVPVTSDKESYLLRYKFPTDRVNRYRNEEDGVGKFSISSMPVFQEIRAKNVMMINEKVFQQSLDGYAVLTRKIESLRLQIWKNDQLYFDSSSLADYPDLPETNEIQKLKNAVIKYEINELGQVRNIEGMSGFNIGDQSIRSLQILESGFPILSQAQVGVGDTWKDTRKTPFTAGEGNSGVMRIEETITLVEVHRDAGGPVAVLSSKRDLKINLYQGSTSDLWKGFSGSGETIGRFALDINEGRIIQTEGRSTLKVSTQINATGSRIDTSTELSFTTKSFLVK